MKQMHQTFGRLKVEGVHLDIKTLVFKTAFPANTCTHTEIELDKKKKTSSRKLHIF